MHYTTKQYFYLLEQKEFNACFLARIKQAIGINVGLPRQSFIIIVV